MTMWCCPKQRPLALLAVVMLLITPLPCNACNSLIINDTSCGGGVVSGATYSEVWALMPRIAIGPPGGERPLLPINDAPNKRASSFGATLTMKYGWVCFGHDVRSLQKVYGAVAPAGTPTDGPFVLCNQGMNDKGLAVALQHQGGNTGIPEFDASSPKKQGLNYWDLTTWLLASFDSAAAVKRALTHDVQVVLTPETTKLLGGSKGPEQWLGVFDAKGAAIMIQFRDGKMEVLDNPLGVMANSPGYLQEHEAKYKQWAKAAGYTLDANLLVTGPVQADPPGKPEAQQTRFVREKIPGGYNGDERFVRLAALKSAALLTQTAGLRSCWPPNTMPGAPGGATNARLTPGYVPKGYPLQQPTMLAVLDILNTVAIPRGVTDSGVLAPIFPAPVRSFYYNLVLLKTLRDHTNKIFYIQTANSYVWRAINLAKFDFQKLKGRVGVSLLEAPHESGVIDVTDSWEAA